MKRLAPLFVVAALAASLPACYGSYGAVKTVHRWNGNATGNKVADSVIHFLITPVYGLAAAGDFFIFNNIEFFTGTKVFQ